MTEDLNGLVDRFYIEYLNHQFSKFNLGISNLSKF